MPADNSCSDPKETKWHFGGEVGGRMNDSVSARLAKMTTVARSLTPVGEEWGRSGKTKKQRIWQEIKWREGPKPYQESWLRTLEGRRAQMKFWSRITVLKTRAEAGILYIYSMFWVCLHRQEILRTYRKQKLFLTDQILQKDLNPKKKWKRGD